MFKTLRNRLIFSHLLPLLIIIPLMGIGLIYVLETQIYLPGLSSELESDAHLLAQVAATQPEIWENPALAQSIVSQQAVGNDMRVILLRPNGTLLASSEAGAGSPAAPALTVTPGDMTTLSGGETINRVFYNQQLSAEVIDVWVPVMTSNHELLGIIRLTYHYASFVDEFFHLRFVITSLLVVGLLLGSVLGYFLAISISKPIQDVTWAIDDLAKHSQAHLLDTSGPEEVENLTQSVNFFVSRLRELEDTRRHLLANLVHELGRPLGALRSAIQALNSGAERDPALYHELLTGMDAETERLQKLLDELAHLHEQVLGTLELDRKDLHIKEWLPTVLRTWQEAAHDKRLHWEVNLPDKPLPSVCADPVRLAQIIGNLVSNAIKFTPVGGQVSISAYPAQDSMCISVADSGPGMTSEELEKIFSPFYRGGHGGRFPQGMGLGLSIASDLAKAHGGRLEVESTPGMGSRFTLWLPLET